MVELQNKVALVTGAGGAIGRAISLRLGDAGALVGVCDQNSGQAAKTVALLEGEGSLGRTITCDVTHYQSCGEAIKSFSDDVGPIDILVNCAGWDQITPFVETDNALWQKIININYIGALNIHHLILPSMIERQYGRIINISSDAGKIGSAGEAVYSGCKAALMGFGKSLAREYANDGITVNTVCPGPTDTPLFQALLKKGEYGEKIYNDLHNAIPMSRLGQPDDVGGIVAFLASDEAAFITGQSISVSGGLSMI